MKHATNLSVFHFSLINFGNFLMQKKSFTLAELAELTQSQLIGDPTYLIFSVADLESAESRDASFLTKMPYGQVSRYEKAMQQSKAGVIFIHPSIVLMDHRNYLLNDDPSRAFQQVLELFNETEKELTGFKGIHPTAVIHPTCKIGQDVHIGPLVVIDQEVTIGDRTSIGAGSFIGAHTVIGMDCTLYARITIREKCLLGHRIVIQPGAVIGSCGFGYTMDKQGHHQKLGQFGTVIIDDDVEIGANTTIDRSRLKSTHIGRGTKIDNLVQIGHGVVLGEDNLIIAQVGISGSTQTGRHVVLAGQVGVTGHLKIGAGVIVAAQAGVEKSLPNAGKYGGKPARPLTEQNRNSVHVRRLEKYAQQIQDLEKRLEALEKH